jgi:hypothetical protein
MNACVRCYGTLCHMPCYHELLLLGADAWLDARVEADRYRLCLYRAEAPVLEYWGDGAIHRRRVRERTVAYDFRSIEQLRYDFERDAEDALGRD